MASLRSRGIPVRRRSEGRLVDLLHLSALVLSRDDREFIPRGAFFRGARFLLAPTAEEVHDEVLIPGHRFLPFASHEVLPWHCTLTGPDERPAARRKIRRRIQDLLMYYTFFGLKNLPMILARDDEHNIDALQENDLTGGEVQITAFDMADPYRRLGFEHGDALRLTVEDWGAGRFRFERLPAGRWREGAARRRAWIARLEEGFEEAFRLLGFPADMEEVLAYAFFFAGKGAMEEPSLHLGGFLEASRKVDLVTIGTDTCLWRRGEAPDQGIAAGDAEEGPRGDDDCLEAILDDLGLSLSPQEIEAYMRDELFQEGRDLRRVMDRCLQGRPVRFYSRAQERAFHRFLRDMWAEVQQAYDPDADRTAGRLRQRALQIYDDHLMWMRSLDTRGFRPGDLPVRSLFEIGQAVGQIGQLLTALNHIHHIPDAEFRTMEEVLQLLEATIWEKIEKVEAALGEPSGPCPEEEAEPEPDIRRADARSLYLLKVTLKGVRPPIWRRIRLPGSSTLAELHRVIQAAMGWGNHHLHSFSIGGIDYGDPATALKGFRCYRDEGRFTLDSLLSREGLAFAYEYDFGDGWEHHVEVERILPIGEAGGEEELRPVCLKGRRACPPEDCGGADLYGRLLAEQEDACPEQVEAFDPERFSLEEINRRLEGL